MKSVESVDHMNSALRTLYTAAWSELEHIRTANPRLSWPLLLKVPAGFDQAQRRLLVIGQQTYGWAGESGKAQRPPVTMLMDEYAKFDLGTGYKATPFWLATRKLNATINADSPNQGLLWSNLVKVDEMGERPSREVEEATAALGLLPAEIEIARPDVIVFFTGPNYDNRLRSSFPGSELVEIDKTSARVVHPALPPHTYRTPHPNYLRLSGQWDTLAKLAEKINQA